MRGGMIWGGRREKQRITAAGMFVVSQVPKSVSGAPGKHMCIQMWTLLIPVQIMSLEKS